MKDAEINKHITTVCGQLRIRLRKKGFLNPGPQET